ncbi:MAG TPA: hypothetical protein VKC90_09330 [Chitinophagaceae bacterium]|nr:hypothetical protein [Chitinophagaceae bacterium]
MKKLLLLSIGTAMIAAVAIAQDQKQEKAAQEVKPAVVQDQKTQEQKDPKQAHAEWEKQLKADLKLTDEQAGKFDALNKEYNDKMDVLMQDASFASLDKDAQKEKKMALKKEKETKLLEFLTPEQQITYKTIIEKKKKEMEAAPKSGS